MKIVFSLRKSEPDSVRATKEIVKEIELQDDNSSLKIDNDIIYNDVQYRFNSVTTTLNDDGQITRKYIFGEDAR